MENELLDDLVKIPLEGKKKKKKALPTNFEDELLEAAAPSKSEEPAAATPAEVKDTPAASLDDDLGLDLSLKKKKKKKAALDTFAMEMDAGLADSDAPAAKPAKEKKAIIGDFDIPDDGESQFDYSESALGDDGLDEEEDQIDYSSADKDPLEALQNTDRDYTYRELLAHAFYVIRKANPDYGGEPQKYRLVPPEVAREGTKKTVFSNFIDICRRMRRDSDHVMNFLFAELGTSGSVDSENRLIIKGRFQPKQIESVLRHYIGEYLTCKICRSRETILTKEHRLLFLHCEKCNSTRSVANINTGFSAQIGRRKR